MDQKLAEAVLRDLIPDASQPDVTPALVMSETASFFGVSMDDLCGSSRSRSLVMARQIAMYLCRELTDLSLPKIGTHFGAPVRRGRRDTVPGCVLSARGLPRCQPRQTPSEDG